MEARREDFGLRAVLAVHGDDPPFGERAAAIDAEELPQVPVGHADERGRRDREEDRERTDHAQDRVGKRVPHLLRHQGRADECDNGAQQQPK